MAAKRTERSRDVAVLPCGNGRIGMAKCPGATSAGDFAGDLAKLRDWGAAAVVTFLVFSERGHARLLRPNPR